jgi:mannonate dehydratase
MSPYRMEQTMRWFGPDDPVRLRDLRQAGCEGVVTALHHVPNGAVWTVDEIRRRQDAIAAEGLRWSVVESLPVHEAVKTGTDAVERFLDHYRQSLTNLAACGLRVVTYNFMPLLDWTRTDLGYTLPDGARALRFELDAVAAYDVFLLQRPGAEADYPPPVLERARQRLAAMTVPEQQALERALIAGLPGSEEQYTRADFRKALAASAEVTADCLQDHLVRFLEAVCPVADDLGVQLALHPDDPPFPLFGLPRVVSTADDLAALFARVPNRSNGLCFCTGSLGVRPDNDLVAMVQRFADRIYFVHLRNIRRTAHGAFHESAHLDGDVDLYAVVKALYNVSVSQRRRLPMRPDHGHQMLDDLHKTTNPGYTAIGRLKGLAELRGLELGIARAHAEAETAGLSPAER